MGKLWDSIKNYWGAKAEAVAGDVREKADVIKHNPDNIERDSKFAIEDSRKQIGEFEGKIAQLIASTKLLERQKTSAALDVQTYTNISVKAAKVQNAKDVQGALTSKSQAQQRVDSVQAEIEKNGQITATLRDRLEKARAKVAQAESNQVRLSARLQGARIRTEMAKAGSEFESSSPLSKLDDLQKAVDAKESEAEGWEEITATKDSDLKDKYDVLATDVDAEAAALMAQFAAVEAKK